jgi:glycosyltransferase involved in cell wall biosynthesis
MKILEIAGSGTIGTSEMGPVSNDIYQLCKRFRDLNHDVTIADAFTDKKRKKLPQKVKLIEIESVPRSYSKFQKKSNFNYAKNTYYNYRILYQILKNEYQFIRQINSRLDVSKFDIIHIHETFPAIIFKKKIHYQYVYTSHTPTWYQIYSKKTFLNHLKKIKIDLITAVGLHEKNAIQNSSLTIGLGRYLREQFSNANIRTIPNGIDLNKWKPIRRKIARDYLGYSENDFLVIFVGRVVPIKGVDILINAIRDLGPNFKDFFSIIIGSLGTSFQHRDEINPYAKFLIKESKELPVKFMGFISNRSNKFRKFLCAADLLVLPSLFEPQGNVILEAMAMGVPVIASSFGGTKDLVTDKVGRLFSPGDHKKLSALLKYYYHNRDELKNMTKYCREHVQSKFTWDICAAKHIDAFEHLKGQYS